MDISLNSSFDDNDKNINKVVKSFSLEYYLEQIKALYVKNPTIKSIMMEN